MAEFSVQLTHPAVRDIDSLPAAIQPAIIEGMMSLRQDPIPAPPVKKKLKGFGFRLFRLRVADYRLLNRIDENTVTVLRVVDRKDLEKAIKRLKR